MSGVGAHGLSITSEEKVEHVLEVGADWIASGGLFKATDDAAQQVAVRNTIIEMQSFTIFKTNNDNVSSL